MNKLKVMIAGIGGASLGTELCKSLQLAGGYEIYGCDVSPIAYGLYDPSFVATYKVDRNNYVASVIDACKNAGTKWLLPGAEQPMVLLSQASDEIIRAGIRLINNSQRVVTLCSNKKVVFDYLKDAGIPIPRTVEITNPSDIEIISLPCIIKPSSESGGSILVFFATTIDEAISYCDIIRRNGGQPIVQEYVDVLEGEFTIGVLSLPDGSIVGSICMRRYFDAKLSVAYRGRGGIISSGYSQGYIGEYPDLCMQAETIAMTIGSCGPINIQGRVRNGIFLPFEINPRFSATTYLRALAGFNEVDIFIRYITVGEKPGPFFVKTGWYLRSLTERYVSEDQLK